MIFADSQLQSFHSLYSNCCEFAVTPSMLHHVCTIYTTDGTKINDLCHKKLCFVCDCVWVCYSGIFFRL